MNRNLHPKHPPGCVNVKPVLEVVFAPKVVFPENENTE